LPRDRKKAFDLAFALALNENVKLARKKTVAYFDNVFTLALLTNIKLARKNVVAYLDLAFALALNKKC
jgi:hypothetical protein